MALINDNMNQAQSGVTPVNRGTGTGFTNLQRILTANQNNKLGGTVAQGITRAGEKTRADINQAGQQFQQQVGEQQQQLGQNAQAVGDILSGAGTGTSQDQIGQFQGILSGQYGGPQGIQNQDQLQSQADTTTQLGQASGTTGGRLGLLQSFAGGGKQYTAGEQTLDSLLLGQGQGAQQLKRARQSVAGVGQQAQNTGSAAQQVAQQLQSKTTDLAQNALGQLGTNITNYDTQQQQAATQAQAARDAYVKNSLNQLGTTGEVDQQTLDALGLGEGTRLFNADLGSILKESTNQATAQNVQTPEQLARIQALGKLGGSFVTGDPSGVLAKYQDASQAGTYAKENPFQTAPSGYAKQVVQNAANQFQSAIDPFQQQQRGSRIDVQNKFGNLNTSVFNNVADKLQNLYQSGYRDSVINDQFMKDLGEAQSTAKDKGGPEALYSLLVNKGVVSPSIGMGQSDLIQNAFNQINPYDANAAWKQDPNVQADLMQKFAGSSNPMAEPGAQDYLKQQALISGTPMNTLMQNSLKAQGIDTTNLVNPFLNEGKAPELDQGVQEAISPYLNAGFGDLNANADKSSLMQSFLSPGLQSESAINKIERENIDPLKQQFQFNRVLKLLQSPSAQAQVLKGQVPQVLT